MRETGQKRSDVTAIRALDTCSPVGSVSCAKGIIDVNIPQFGQRRPKGVDLLLRGLGLQQRTCEANTDVTCNHGVFSPVSIIFPKIR